MIDNLEAYNAARRKKIKPKRLFEVIWSSDEAHTVDALAVRGDEGRGSLR